MELQPIHRRYGYGAAHLPIGVPIGSVSLAEVARTPIRLERSFALVPGLLCASLAMLLATVSSFYESAEEPTLTAVEPSTIDLHLWITPSRIASRPPVPIAAPIPIVAPATSAIADATSLPLELTASLPQTTPEPFAPRVLAMAPMLSVPTGQVDFVEVAIRPGRQLRPTSNSAPDHESLEEIARNTTPVRSFSAPFTDVGFESASTSGPLEHRPSNSAISIASSNTPKWSSQAKRSAFLAALSEETSSGSPSASDGEPRSHVAAAAAANEIAREIRGRVARQARDGGWHEVPLDELPDCSPPGRQDELKKQILLAATRTPERECFHQGGHYRFLETRNLNAFLMWSRHNPDSSFGQRPAHDVCDVLTRALLCLSEGSMKDL